LCNIDCVAGEPSVEACNGLDDDCNGLVDDACDDSLADPSVDDADSETATRDEPADVGDTALERDDGDSVETDGAPDTAPSGNPDPAAGDASVGLGDDDVTAEETAGEPSSAASVVPNADATVHTSDSVDSNSDVTDSSPAADATRGGGCGLARDVYSLPTPPAGAPFSPWLWGSPWLLALLLSGLVGARRVRS
jgi:hypothetical protein